MTTAVRPDDQNWWWVECDCGYRQGPFLYELDAMEDGEQHADDFCPDRTGRSTPSKYEEQSNLCPACHCKVTTRDHWHMATEAIEMLTANLEQYFGEK